MKHSVKTEILKSLPLGARVYYFGPSEPLAKSKYVLTKVCDRSNHMRVSNGKKEFRIKYYNLTCDSILTAAKVADVINSDGLPF